MRAGRLIAGLVGFPLMAGLSGCVGIGDLVSGPDPATYDPIAIVRDADTYSADLALCRIAQAKTGSGFHGAAVAVSGAKAAVSNAPAAAASGPLYIGEVGAAVGTEALDQATGARTPRMRAFMDCIRNATNQDRSAVVADQH
jgi:hypothetical protein